MTGQERCLYTERVLGLGVHKSIKSNTSMAKSPARTVRTQSNPIFMSLYATA
jgi:hypothetical protein